MTKITIGLLLMVAVLGSTGCQMGWEQLTPTIGRVSEIALVTAFSREDVKIHKAEICNIVDKVADVLDNIDQPDITFDQIRDISRQTIVNMNINADVTIITLIVADQVFDVAFQYVETYYNDLLQEDRVKVVIGVARAISNGFRNACDGLSTHNLKTSRIFK